MSPQVEGIYILQGQVKCLVSIGTGVPSLKPFKVRRAAQRRDAGGERHVDEAYGREVPTRDGAAKQHGAILPLQLGAGTGGHWSRRGEEGQEDGGSDAAVYQLTRGAHADAGVRRQYCKQRVLVSAR